MSVTTEQIDQAIRGTRDARERAQHHSTDAIMRALARTAKNWLEPTSPWRQRAIEEATAVTGFSREMINEAVNLTFGAITEEALRELSDGFAAAPSSAGRPDIRVGAPTKEKRIVDPRLIVHFLAGNVPAPGIVSICCGLLLQSANLVKVSSRDPVFPTLFIESLREVDAELADCVAVLDWRRDEVALTQAALAEADAVIAYGDDETIAALRRMCRPGARVLGYGHKLSFAVVLKEAMTKKNLPRLAEAAAFDASIYDQQGCLSPHAFYVEDGGQLSPREFAAALADAMAAYQTRIPRGQLSVEEAAQIAKLRGAYEFRAASDRTVAIWAGAAATSGPPLEDPLRRDSQPLSNSEAGQAGWLVIYEEDPMFTPSCLNRVAFVKPIGQLESIPKLMQRFASNLSTVGVAPMNERTTALAGELAKIGVERVCSIGQMQRPPLTWQLGD